MKKNICLLICIVVKPNNILVERQSPEDTSALQNTRQAGGSCSFNKKKKTLRNLRELERETEEEKSSCVIKLPEVISS